MSLIKENITVLHSQSAKGLEFDVVLNTEYLKVNGAEAYDKYKNYM